MTLPAGFTDPGLIAHRGLHSDGIPENTIAAISAAIDRGYGIEIDVQISSDDVAMVFHDEDLTRLCGRCERVDTLSSEMLRQIEVAGTRQRIPTLSQVLGLVRGRVPILVEIKDQDGQMGPDIGRLERAVVRDLRDYEGPIAVMSFNPHSVAAMVDLLPEIPRGLVTSAFQSEDWPDLPAETRATLREIPDADAVGASFISHQSDALSMPRVAELKRSGIAILCWTIRSPEQELTARLVADGVTFEGYLP
ncbi:glycerophosphodiester phosphodiesterase family protein [Jannaschia aquimarina]|uniref:UgpQ protein n=1 Tax=Jannaschia aquimarina TaxID=935700 RepID=A0A0D1CKX1_9RHOB|nr:glycerophosphodiester phosphodiesterase family protein [Jannaschia aquimarina]KIT15432.1 Glycerophosphoryl diester phosphodiesterase [Jannaschia aquimarina]SNT22443.1 Glycerophosphoryl diester phosphodiesterase [Jannaschia aquimarina]